MATRSLVTGATGYIGGRLVPELLDAGHDVRVLVRDEAKARAHLWANDVEIAVGDATEADDVRSALQGTDVAYYLLHSIGTGGMDSSATSTGGRCCRSTASCSAACSATSPERPKPWTQVKPDRV
jgi:uncharacterized protein YbjT (DUF2867 family)